MNVDVLSSRLVSKLGSNRRLVVALDGPGGAGKSTIARKLSERCNLISTIFVATPKAECLARLIKRGENTDEWIRRWRAAEDYYLTHIDTASAVSVVVSGIGNPASAPLQQVRSRRNAHYSSSDAFID